MAGSPCPVSSPGRRRQTGSHQCPRRKLRESMKTFAVAAIAGVSLLNGFFDTPALGQQTASSPVWTPAKAAAYLDARLTWWISWPKAAYEQGTFCVSCHTATPFSLGRAALRGPLGESVPSSNEQKLLDSVIRRVRAWREVEPFYSDQARGLPKTSESRGTESILNSLILAWRDAPTGQLSAD